MDRTPSSGDDYAVLSRLRRHVLRHLVMGLSAPVAVLAGLVIFSLDALVAPDYGLSVLYIVLLIAMIPCASKRLLVWMTVGFMSLSVLGFMIGQAGAPSVPGVVRLVIGLAALVLTALLIIVLRPNEPVLILRGSRATDRALSTRDPERVALFARLGETVSIADDVVQQLTATILGSAACRSWLDRPVPDLVEAQTAIEDSIASARRAGELVQRLRHIGQGVPCGAIALPRASLDQR